MKSLKRLHDILSFGNKFNVIVVPSNDFGEQEPWDEPEIEEYIRGHFKAEFPIMAKSVVTGQEALDLWKWVAGKAQSIPPMLSSSCELGNAGILDWFAETSEAPKWNFDKYLINREGVIVKHWPGETTVESIFTTVQNLVDGTDFRENPTRVTSGTDTKGESSGDEEEDVEEQRKDEL